MKKKEKKMTPAGLRLEEAVIEFYREEIRLRYQLKNMRRFEAFDPVPDDTLNRLRDFFIGNIYPPVHLRHQYDEAFEHLSAILHSPRRLRPMLKTALASAWRLGPLLPAAVSAGITTVDSLKKTRRLESLMMEAAAELGLSPEDIAHHERMIKVIDTVPEKAVYDLIHDVISYFRAMTNIRMLDAMLEIMERCGHVMESRPDIYSREEREGVALGVELVRAGLGIFRSVNKKMFPPILKGIEAVEYDWFLKIKEEAVS